MRRAGNLWPEIASFDALLTAAQRAARGKRQVRSVARFLERAEPECLRLERELLAETWRPGRPHTFEVRDPKRRTISAAPFEDRVVHHALMDRLEPVLDRRMVAESFACRQGKGSHAALAHARRMLRRHGWFLKLDVQRFFPSLRHEVVMEAVGRAVKDRHVLALCEAVLGGPDGTDTVGLPIGNLTSQWFANLVLDRLDHFVKETLRGPGYVRYMDDFVLFDDGKDRLRDAHAAVAGFLDEALGLALKPRATLLAPHHVGLPFLGFRLYRGTVRVRPANLRRLRRKLRRRDRQRAAGLLDEQTHARSVRSIVAHLAHGSTLGLRRRLFPSGLPPPAAGRQPIPGVGSTAPPTA